MVPMPETKAIVTAVRSTWGNTTRVNMLGTVRGTSYVVDYEYTVNGRTYSGTRKTYGYAPEVGSHFDLSYDESDPGDAAKELAATRRPHWSTPWLAAATVLLIYWFRHHK